MGNSPSKDERTSTNNAPTSSSSIGEVETDEPPLSSLPKPVPGTSSKPKIRTRRRSSREDSQMDEIGVSMAKLLQPSPPKAQSTVSVEKPLDLAFPLPMQQIASSVDSKDSPVFTSSNDDSSSSCSSFSPYDLEGEDNLLSSIKEETLESKVQKTSIKSNFNELDIVSATKTSSAIVTKLTCGRTSSSKRKSSIASSSSISHSPNSVSSNSHSKSFDIDAIIDSLLHSGLKTSRRKTSKLPVSSSEIKHILHKARAIFLSQPTLLRLSPPVKIVGDIHGQFHDLIRIFNSCGYPPYSNYLFLGDYVDRGRQSLETFLLLMCYKIKYPENFFMLRGNHESANITKIYGFYDECKRRLGSAKIWKEFVDVFNTLPIAATINDKIFCIHGGLSPELSSLSLIEQIHRPTDIPDKGLLADLLWSDPDPAVKNFSINNWPKNDRGVSYTFGRKHVEYFCSKFDIDLIVRGHMVVQDGYEFFSKRKLVTVFSAPNYCGEFDNFGAVMSVDTKLCCSFELLKPTSKCSMGL